MKDTSDIPNPDRTTFNEIWTDWSEIHDQKSLSKKGVFRLRQKAKVPEGGKPFYVELCHPLAGGEPRMTLDESQAKHFHGDYLLKTCWEWERQFEAVPV